MTTNEQALPVEQALNLFPLAGEDSLARFERLAAWFYRETGMLAPGKDEPMYGAGPESRAEREVAYGAWFSAKIERARDALSQPASGGVAREKVLREALLQIEFRSTNHGAWFEQDPFGEYSKLGDIARAALAGQRTWRPHLDYAGEPMAEGQFRDPPTELDAALAAPGQDEGVGS